MNSELEPSWFSSSKTQPRYMWDQSVREFYHERCYLYLITGHDPDNSATFSIYIRGLMKALEINSATVHAVFGTYDLLIRFWGTHAARQRFLRGLKEHRVEVMDIQEFASESVTYVAEDHASPNERVVLENLHNIERVAHSIERGEDEYTKLLTENLVGLGLIQVIKSSAGIKFYMFFREHSEQQRQPGDFLVQQLHSVINSTNLQSVTIYEGVGFCSYVIKAVSSTFDELLPMVDTVRKAARNLHLSSWTLPIADYGTAIVGETIDAIDRELPSILESFVSSSVHDEATRSLLRRELASRPRTQRNALEAKLDESRQLLLPPELERFYEVVQAVLLRDRKLLNRSLSFMTSIEDDLRFFLPRVLAECLGQEWLKQLRSAGLSATPPGKAEKAEEPDIEIDGWISTSTSPRNWSLYGMLSALSFAYASFPDLVAPKLHRYLPDGWRTWIRRIVIIRDDFAHGKVMIYVRDDDFSGHLGSKLLDIAVALKFQTALESAVSGS